MKKIGSLFFLLIFLLLLSGEEVFAENLSSQGIADLSRPGVLQVGTHITGKVSIPRITVDARARTVEIIPDEKKELQIDEYFSGSGFVIQEEGFIATNAHVVSLQTIKRRLATERALAALYENALTLSDDEMESLLKEGKDGFINKVFETIITNSSFELSKEVKILNPKRGASTFVGAFQNGEVAEVLVESPNFLSGGTDLAILKIGKKPAPALALSDQELAVGDRVYLSGFPATAETSQLSSGDVTFTSGVVSAIRVSPEGKKIYQTDAKVSQGSSGGPVLSEQGEVVGIVTFQTDTLERKSGDNFAFAQSTQALKEMVDASRIDTKEGLYGTTFRNVFRAYVERRCNDMNKALLELGRMSDYYDLEKSFTSYKEECSLWQATGESSDTPYARIQETLISNKSSFWWLFLGSLIFTGTMVIFILWLFRQLQRDEAEIKMLEKRIAEDESEILRQRKESHQWFLEHDQANEHSLDKEQ
jgi:Trypsin-like peptidase domain